MYEVSADLSVVQMNLDVSAPASEEVPLEVHMTLVNESLLKRGPPSLPRMLPPFLSHIVLLSSSSPLHTLAYWNAVKRHNEAALRELGQDIAGLSGCTGTLALVDPVAGVSQPSHAQLWQRGSAGVNEISWLMSRPVCLSFPQQSGVSCEGMRLHGYLSGLLACFLLGIWVGLELSDTTNLDPRCLISRERAC